uniref:Uncharacterized protein n=1 Tax=Timema douglasi TaxID=61478 RepID=A0A7R8VC90_TIMDO|nr:unnamed protein product [Timema douglasi]
MATPRLLLTFNLRSAATGTGDTCVIMVWKNPVEGVDDCGVFDVEVCAVEVDCCEVMEVNNSGNGGCGDTEVEALGDSNRGVRPPTPFLDPPLLHFTVDKRRILAVAASVVVSLVTCRYLACGGDSQMRGALNHGKEDSLSLDKSKKEETVCYEDFCENSMSNTKDIPQETNEEFLLFYDNLNIAELHSLATKFGPLLRKERFIFMDQYRRCWAGLIGHLLLVYSGERDTKPSFNIDLHGYEARPAPNYIQRDLKRRDMCFEIVCPGKKTFHTVVYMEHTRRTTEKEKGGSHRAKHTGRGNARDTDTLIIFWQGVASPPSFSAMEGIVASWRGVRPAVITNYFRHAHFVLPVDEEAAVHVLPTAEGPNDPPPVDANSQPPPQNRR